MAESCWSLSRSKASAGKVGCIRHSKSNPRPRSVSGVRTLNDPPDMPRFNTPPVSSIRAAICLPVCLSVPSSSSVPVRLATPAFVGRLAEHHFANFGHSHNDRQPVVFEQDDRHAVRQHNSLGRREREGTAARCRFREASRLPMIRLISVPDFPLRVSALSLGTLQTTHALTRAR